jgi:hypothetical protein
VRLVRGADNLPPSMSRLSRQCGIINISQPYWPPWPGTGRAVIFFLLFYNNNNVNNNNNTVALVRERTIPTERLPLADEVSANFFCG